jgi:maleylacetate reductase
MAAIARALGAEDAAQGLFDLAGAVGARRALAELGMRAEDIRRIAALAAENPYWNPRPVSEARLHALLDDAFQGRRPGAPRTEIG